MIMFTSQLLYFASLFFIAYLLLYAIFSYLAIAIGAYKLYQHDRILRIKKDLEYRHFPISILVPAYNEEITIISSIKSLLAIDYHPYEIVVIDDGSTDKTSQRLIDAFGMEPTTRTIEHKLQCQPQDKLYEKVVNGITITLIRKKNGGKGDALNMGINACNYPYFICMDADSKLLRDSLKKIIQPIIEDNTVVSVGGMLLISQCVLIDDSNALRFRFPANLIVSLQVVEYARSFLSSRILMDSFNGNLIISGAFGLFNKSMVVATGGYSPNCLGEDMELVLKLHGFCRNNNIKYRMRYQPEAICMTQVPMSLKDLRAQRRRWHLGLFQSMHIHRRIMLNHNFGLVSFFSFLYYLFYELVAPFIEVFGIFTVILAAYFGLLDVGAMVLFFSLYALYGGALSLASFSQHMYIQKLKISSIDMLKTLFLCILEFGFFRHTLVFVRFAAFFRYGKNKRVWGKIKRV